MYSSVSYSWVKRKSKKEREGYRHGRRTHWKGSDKYLEQGGKSTILNRVKEEREMIVSNLREVGFSSKGTI